MKNKGFTIIEVLVVVAIIGILASAVVVAVGGGTAAARDARRLSDISHIATAVLLYKDKIGVAPGGRGDQSSVSSWESLNTAVTGADVGISKVPNDPLNAARSVTYVYGATDDGQEFVLQATLEKPNASVMQNSYTGSVSAFTVNTGDLDCTGQVDKNNYCVKY